MTRIREAWISAVKRAAHTATQTALGGIGTATLIEQVPWSAVASMTALAAVVSLLKSVTVGTPETDMPALRAAAEAAVTLHRAEAPEAEQAAAIDRLGALVLR